MYWCTSVYTGVSTSVRASAHTSVRTSTRKNARKNACTITHPSLSLTGASALLAWSILGMGDLGSSLGSGRRMRSLEGLMEEEEGGGGGERGGGYEMQEQG